MKVDEFNYNISILQSRAKILSKYLSRIFFDEFDEFDSIIIEYEYTDSKAIFYICFNSITNENIKAIEFFYKFIELKYNWIIKIKNFDINDDPMAYIEFKLNERMINDIISKLEVKKRIK